MNTIDSLYQKVLEDLIKRVSNKAYITKDIGCFLESYVFSGGNVTKNIESNNKVDVSEIVASINNQVFQQNKTTLTVSLASTTYYLDFKKDGTYNWNNSHPSGSVGTDYLTVAEINTDESGMVDTITDKRDGVGNLRFKTDIQIGEGKLVGMDTRIVYETFTIISADNGDGTFTYQDDEANNIIGTRSPEGYQTFKLTKGTYVPGKNMIHAFVDDTLHRSVGSGGLVEDATDEITLTAPIGNGSEISFIYYKTITSTAGSIPTVSTTEPTEDLYDGLLWVDMN